MPFFDMDLSVPFQYRGILATITFRDVADIFIVAAILYKIYELLADTRAITLIKGLLVLLSVTVLASFLDLHVIAWLLQKTLTLIFVALPIVFQPELRRALEHLGQGGFIGRSVLLDDNEAQNVTDELVTTVKTLSATKTGALIVIERSMGLNDISSKGVQIDGLVSANFLLNVFIVNTPLHDGAAIIRGKRLVAAACVLPLTSRRDLSTELGTRHRAALGLSEQCDALIIVVSEETGTISIAQDGHMIRHLNAETLRKKLEPVFFNRRTTFKELISSWRSRELS